MSTQTLRCEYPYPSLLGEGPLWHADKQSLIWVDIKSAKIYCFNSRTQRTQCIDCPEAITSLAIHHDGGYMATTLKGFARLNESFDIVEYLGDVEPEFEYNRFNDGKIDPQGRYWAGTMDDQEGASTGSLYSLVKGKVSKHDDGYICTNGPTFSPCGKTLYHTDTFGNTIFAFDVADDGSLSNKRVFIEIPKDEGFPDGMTTDANGNLWVCHWGGWRITQFDSNGNKLRHIALPVSNVTSCTFGGKDLNTLYVTTAAIGLSHAQISTQQPLAGSMFSIQMDCDGLPTPVFKG